MIHPKAHLNMLNMGIIYTGKWWKCCQKMDHSKHWARSPEKRYDPSTTRRNEGAAGVNKSSLYITGRLDKSDSGCAYLIWGKQQGCELTQFEWIWTRLAITQPNTITVDSQRALIMHVGFWISSDYHIRCLALHLTIFVSSFFRSEQNLSLPPYFTSVVVLGLIMSVTSFLIILAVFWTLW